METLEKRLSDIFKIVSHWKAALLLDEADIFVEQRANSDIHRNALVSVLLRKLEYYEGILFLTTNRVKVTDEAIASRIHFVLRYGNLDHSARKGVWRSFLRRANTQKGATACSSKDVERLAGNVLNGREVSSSGMSKAKLIDESSRSRMPYQWRKLWQLRRRVKCDCHTSKKPSPSIKSSSVISAEQVK